MPMENRFLTVVVIYLLSCIIIDMKIQYLIRYSSLFQFAPMVIRRKLYVVFNILFKEMFVDLQKENNVNCINEFNIVSPVINHDTGYRESGQFHH
jgi:hypothetical protein